MACKNCAEQLPLIKCTRDSASFVFTDNEQSAIGVVAIAASIAGASAQAASTAAATGEEDADYLEFALDGQPVKGWVWRSPFKNGDVVEVIVQWQHDHFEAFAIARPEDRMVALYPHCSRGRKRHWSNALKWWLTGSTFVVLSMLVMFLLVELFNSDSWAETGKGLAQFVPELIIFTYPFFLLMTYFLARRWMSFVRLAERIFTEFGWADPAGIDLKRSSKEQRTAEDVPEFGVFFFRY